MPALFLGSFVVGLSISAVCYFLKTCLFSIFLKFTPLSANMAFFGGSFLVLGLFWGVGRFLALNIALLRPLAANIAFLSPRGFLSRRLAHF